MAVEMAALAATQLSATKPAKDQCEPRRTNGAVLCSEDLCMWVSKLTVAAPALTEEVSAPAHRHFAASVLNGGVRGSTGARIAGRGAHSGRLLAWRSDTLTARGQGLQLGLQLGWPVQLVEPLSRQLHVQHATMPAWTADPTQPLSCANVDAQLALVAQLASKGEGEPLMLLDPTTPP